MLDCKNAAALAFVKKKARTLLLCMIFSASLCTNSVFGAVAQGAAPPAIGIAPSQTEILERYRTANITLGDRQVDFVTKPQLSAPYAAGQVAQGELDQSLQLLNFIRYVAGVPNDVTVRPEYTSLAQNGAALMAANQCLSHTQLRREGISEDFFALGSRGTAECNLGRGYGDISASLLSYLQDTDYLNIFRMGHRRWLLNPSMQATGFGFAEGYSATYAFDRTRKGDLNFDHIAWPAVNTPIELCTPRKGNYAFSVVLGPAYAPAILEGITVTLSCGNQTWTLNSADHSLDSFLAEKRFLGVNTDGYGPANCVIFSVGAFEAGDQVDVSIKGLVKDGKAAELSYRVNFFSLESEDALNERGTVPANTLNG